MTHHSKHYSELAGMLDGSHMHNIVSDGNREGPIVMITHKKNGNVNIRFKSPEVRWNDEIVCRPDTMVYLITPERI